MDKLRAYDFTFLLRFGNAFQLAQKAFRCVHPDEIHIKGIFKNFFHLVAFVLAQKTVVHKDAGELFADGFVYHDCGHGGIHAAAEGAKHLFVPHLCPDFRYFAFHKGFHGPVAFQAADCKQKITDHFFAERRVLYFRMELHPIEFFLRIAHRGRGAVTGDRQYFKACRWLRHKIIVAHPADVLINQIAEQG